MVENIGPEALDDIGYPAFLVCGKTITAVNKPAEAYNIPLKTDVNKIIDTGVEEHKAFKKGRLYLTLKIGQMYYCASVVRAARRREIFYIESEIIDPAMVAVGAAASRLLDPLMETMSNFESYKKKQQSQNNQELNAMHRNLTRMYRDIINMYDASDYAKQRSTELVNSDVKADIATIVNHASEILNYAGKRIEYTACPENIFSQTDKEKIERAILNMISNVAKIIHDDTPIYAYLERDQHYYRFSVTCPWIYGKHTNLNDILDIYHRKPTTAAFAGDLTMGAVIARNAATSHGGVLIVDQPDSKTMRFTMSLPIILGKSNTVHSAVALPTDYCRGYDHYILEFSDILQDDFFETKAP